MDRKCLDVVSSQSNYAFVNVRRIYSSCLGSAHRQDAQSLLFENGWRIDTIPLYPPHPGVSSTDPENALLINREAEDLSQWLFLFCEDRHETKTIEPKKSIGSPNPKITVRCLGQSLNSPC
jgi:hypothetical protein